MTIAYPAFAKNLPELLREPTNIAILASIGVHAAIALSLSTGKPVEPEAAQKLVQVVELTPAEQSRLPQFSTPQTALPPQTLTPNLSLKQTVPVPSQSNSSLPPPPADDLSNYNYKFDLNSPTLQDLQNFAGATGQTNSSDTRRTESSPSSRYLGGSSTSTNKTSSSTRTSDKDPGKQQTTNTSTPKPESTPTGKPTTPSTESRTTPPANSATPPKIPDAAIAQLRELQARQLFLYSPAGTTRDQATANLQTWLAKVKQTTPNLWGKPTELTPTYPKEACPYKLEGNAAVGILVDPQGKIVDQPEVIQSTGYKILNQQAVETVKAYHQAELKPPGEFKPYLFYIPFKYSKETCPAQAPTPSASPS